jgi:hypothetical protein
LLLLLVGDDRLIGHRAHSLLHKGKLAMINTPYELSGLTDHRKINILDDHSHPDLFDTKDPATAQPGKLKQEIQLYVAEIQFGRMRTM